MDDKLIKQYFLEEIKTIQDIIKRMASNSFLLKGWTVTLVTATLLIKVAVDNKYIVLIGFLPLLSFWILDAFYLQKEKLYRKLYDWIINNRLTDREKTRKCFDMSTTQFTKKVPSVFCLMFSTTLSIFYIFTIILLSTYFCVLHYNV